MLVKPGKSDSKFTETENREGKISNKSHNGNIFNTNVKLFCVFRKNNGYVSSECKNLADDKKKKD